MWVGFTNNGINSNGSEVRKDFRGITSLFYSRALIPRPAADAGSDAHNDKVN